MKKLILPILVPSLIFAFQTAAFAQPVYIDGEPIPFTVTVGEETKQENLDRFDLLGVIDGSSVAIRYNGNVGQVSREEFETLLPLVDLSGFPSANGLTELTQGSSGDSVMAMQQGLISLGYLQGVADGIYGGGTAAAVKSFQDDNGLEGTGTADLVTYLAVQDAAAGTLDKRLTLTFPMKLTPEEKFAAIYDETDDDLTPFLDSTWKFSFDRFEGTGMLDLGLPAGTPAVESPAIDRIMLETSFKVIVARDDTSGLFTLIPAFVIDSTGAYRPYVQKVSFFSGSKSCEVNDAVSTGSIEGVTLKEHAYLPLTAEAVAFLKENEDISVRITGSITDYDYNLGADRGVFKTYLDTVENCLS